MAAPRKKRASTKGSARRRTLEPRRAPEGEQSRDTVRFILEAAARVLVESGWAELSTNKVAKAAGISIGALYHYFPGREAIARALVHKIWDDELAAILAVASGGEIPTFPAVARAYVEHVAREPRLHAEWSTHVVQLAADDARAWDEKVIGLLSQVFDLHYEDHPRKRIVCEVIYVSAIHLARRAALLHPDLLRDGTIARELVALVEGYLAPFARKRDG